MITTLQRPQAVLAPTALVVVLAAAGAAVTVSPRLALLGPVALAGAFALVRPDVCLLALLALKPVLDYFVRHDAGGISIGQAWGGALLLTAAIFVVTRPSDTPMLRGYRAPVAFLVAYPLLTFTRAHPGNSPINELRLASWLAVVLVVERLASTPEGQRRVVRLGVVMALLLAGVIALLYETNQYGRAYYTSTSAFAQLDAMQPAGVSAFAVYCSALAIVPLIGGRRTLGPLLLYAALGAGVVLSLVRTSFFAFLLVFAGILARGLYQRRGAIIATGVAVGLALVGAVVGYHDVISSRLVHASGRVLFWRPVLDGTLAHPASILVGHGPTFSFTVIQQALNESIWSHNDFVDLFGTGGAVLLVAYVALVLWLARSALALMRDPEQSRRARDVGYVGLLVSGAYVVIAMFNDAVFASSAVAVAVLFGLVRGMSQTPGRTWVD
ncbi:MAG TPA: hypothetical protein VGC78_08320 [Gaiellaceae bacterium]